MSYRLPPLAAFRAFEAAARHLSFKNAAAELHVTPAAISQQIKGLEEYLAVPLFRRLTRALEVTPQGLGMLAKIREGFDCLAAAVETTRQAGDSVLTVTAPPSFASRWLVPRLPSLAAAWPELVLRLASSPDSVDQRGEVSVFDQGPVDPRDAESEVAIRYGTGNYPGMQVQRIFTPEWLPVCSPGLATADRPLEMLSDLRHHVLIHDQTIADQEQHSGWCQWLAAAKVPPSEVDPQKGTWFSNTMLAVDAALAGQGVALALKPLVQADVAAGRLVIPFAISVTSAHAYYLVMPQAISQRPSVAAFRDWLLAEGAQVGATP